MEGPWQSVGQGLKPDSIFPIGILRPSVDWMGAEDAVLHVDAGH